ncbi:hypothetical protein ACFFKE_02895 [Streptomyces mutabilis]
MRTGADGAAVTDIAGSPHLSGPTVRNHLAAAIGKTAAGALREARQGWV